MANTIFTQKSSCLDAWKFGNRQASKVDHPIHHLQLNSKIKYNRFAGLQQNLVFRLPNDSTRKMSTIVYSSIIPGIPVSLDNLRDYWNIIVPGIPLPSDDNWTVWILGTILAILIPSLSVRKWGPSSQQKEKMPTEEAGQVAKLVEEVADWAKNWADESLKYLPRGKTRLAVLYVKKVAKFIRKLIRLPEKELAKYLEDKEKESTTRQENTVATTEKEDQK